MKIRTLSFLALPIALTIVMGSTMPAFTAAIPNGHDNSGPHTLNLPRAASTWARTYGSSGNDRANSIAKTNDGGYIVAGSTTSFGSGGADAWVIKLDGAGNVQWQKAYGGGGADGVGQVIATKDGGYVLAGCIVGCVESPNSDAWVFKLDTLGNVLWDKSIGGGSGDTVFSVAETGDLGYIVAGYSYSFQASTISAWVFKLDGTGKMVWQRRLLGSGDDHFFHVFATPDNNFLLLGQTTLTSTFADWIVKIDTDGNVLWQRRYGGAVIDEPWAAAPTGDGGYVVVGRSYSFGLGNFDGFAFRIDGMGNLIWQRAFGAGNLDQISSVVRSPDGGYVVAGSTNSFGAGGYDAWLLKLNEDGNIVWQRTYGGSGDDSAIEVTNSDDGGYAVAGTTTSYGAGNTEAWVLKLDAAGNIGNLGGGCTLVGIPSATIITPTLSVVTTTYTTADTNATWVASGAMVTPTMSQTATQCSLFNQYVPAIMR